VVGGCGWAVQWQAARQHCRNAAKRHISASAKTISLSDAPGSKSASKKKKKTSRGDSMVTRRRGGGASPCNSRAYRLNGSKHQQRVGGMVCALLSSGAHQHVAAAGCARISRGASTVMAAS